MPNFYPGIVGARGANPLGVVIHNDAGSQAATAAFYQNWLPTHNAYNGFAHYYVGSGIYQAEDEKNMAWHTANAHGNANYIGIEACQSMGNEATFRANEQACFKLAAEILKRYELPANRTTVMLHQEFVATSCPHRSWELHGAALNAVKDYYISEIQKYMNNNTGNNNQNTNTPKIELGEIGMFIYWKARDKSGKTRDMYGVWGNKRFHLNTNAKAEHFREIVKVTTGRNCPEWRTWAFNDETVKLVESFTELQKTVI